MLLNKISTSSKEFSISKIFSQLRDSYSNRKNAKFWFAPLLSLSQDIEPNNLILDLSKNEHEQLLRMLSALTSDLLAFYTKTPPQQIYKLLEVVRAIFMTNPKESQFQGFHMVMHQVHFDNTLALFLIRNRQYSYAYQCFQSIIEIVKNDTVDVRHEIFLVAISNYLTFVRAHQYANVNKKIGELLGHLQSVYQGLLDKYLSLGCLETNLIIMLATFKQHQHYFSKSFVAQNGLLIKKYENMNKDARENVTENGKLQHFYTKNKGYKIGQIKIKKKQLNFFAASVFARESSLKKQSIYNKSTEATINISEFADQKHEQKQSKQKMYLSVKAEQLKKNIEPKLQQSVKLNQLQQTQQKPKQQKKVQIKVVEKHRKIFNKSQPIILKIGHSILELIPDGLILSDFLRERKRFLTWQQVFTLLKNLRFSFVFLNNLPIACYYDIAKILSPFIYKGDSEKGVAVSDTPKQNLELNVLTRVFIYQAQFMKVCTMNQYDVSRVQFQIDCFLLHFEEFFKSVSQNEYIIKLNNKIFKIQQEEPKLLHIQQWKRKKDSVVEQLSNFIQLQKLSEMSLLKVSPFKILLIMANNKQILVYQKQTQTKGKDQQNNQCLILNVVPLHETKQQQQQTNLKVPYYKLQRYFPIDMSNCSQWMKNYGRNVIYGYLGCFLDFPFSYNNLQCFSTTIFAKKVQMVKQGRYYTAVTAELVGCIKRIWGICIRYFDQNTIKESTTFIYNPYPELLRPVIKLNLEERKKVFVDQLFEGSVAATYKKLNEVKKTGTMMNLIDYWVLIDY